MDDEAGRALFYILVEAEGGSAGKPLILWTNVRHSAFAAVCRHMLCQWYAVTRQLTSFTQAWIRTACSTDLSSAV